MRDEKKERAILGSTGPSESIGSIGSNGSDTIAGRVDRLIALYLASPGNAGEANLGIGGGIGGETGDKDATPAMGSSRMPEKEFGAA